MVRPARVFKHSCGSLCIITFMITLAERIVAEAESYVGTPWKHQGKLRGLGIDCANFVANVINAARTNSPPIVLANDYKPQEDGTVMMAYLGSNAEFVLTEDRQFGDVIALLEESAGHPTEPRHLAFVKAVTPKTTFIIHVTRHGVRSHRMDSAWMRRVHSCWRAHD